MKCFQKKSRKPRDVFLKIKYFLPARLKDISRSGGLSIPYCFIPESGGSVSGTTFIPSNFISISFLKTMVKNK